MLHDGQQGAVKQHVKKRDRTRAQLMEAALRLMAEIAAAEPLWGGLLLSAFTEFEGAMVQVCDDLRSDVELGTKQGQFLEQTGDLVVEAHLALLRAGLRARLAGAGADVSARAAEYQLRILGMTIEGARGVIRAAGQTSRSRLIGAKRAQSPGASR